MTIEETCDVLKQTLIAKNKAYGNSAERGSLFGRVSPEDAILVRMSDKISRLINMSRGEHIDDLGETFNDTVLDLAGYCVLYLVTANNNKGSKYE